MAWSRPIREYHLRLENCSLKFVWFCPGGIVVCVAVLVLVSKIARKAVSQAVAETGKAEGSGLHPDLPVNANPGSYTQQISIEP